MKKSLENIIEQKYDAWLRGKHYRIIKRFDKDIVNEYYHNKNKQNEAMKTTYDIYTKSQHTTINGTRIPVPDKLPDMNSQYNHFKEFNKQYELLLKNTIDSIINVIHDITMNPDDQARLAINMVQNIPYDYEFYETIKNNKQERNINNPYEVLLGKKGVCSETSLLLVHLLHGLGYGVGEFHLPTENHVATGIKVNSSGYRNTGYAFIETTIPSIIGFNLSDDNGINNPRTFSKIFDGKSFDNNEELTDVKRYNDSIAKGDYYGIEYTAVSHKYQASIPTNKNVLDGLNHNR